MRTDYKQLPSGDLDLSGGDLIVTESTGQHHRDIILADKGHIRNAPGLGVGVTGYLNDPDRADLLRSIRLELTADGMNVRSIKNTSENLQIDAEYED